MWNISRIIDGLNSAFENIIEKGNDAKSQEAEVMEKETLLDWAAIAILKGGL